MTDRSDRLRSSAPPGPQALDPDTGEPIVPPSPGWHFDRRDFLAGVGGTLLAGGLVPQLVQVAHAAKPLEDFTIAYISDSHLYVREKNLRFVRSLERAVQEVNALDPQPDFVVFGGDLAQLGRKEELDTGREILATLKAPKRMIVGEHDWYYDMGDAWKERFGPDRYVFEHKGVVFVALNSVVENDFWTEKGWNAETRMNVVSGLDDRRQNPFTVGEAQREWLRKALKKYKDDQPVVVLSHSPLYKYYKGWNFWTDDAEQVQEILSRFQSVTVLHGHTHQLLTNKIGNIHFHGMMSTAWPWPYAPEGLPQLTIRMDRPDPFSQFDGCGRGTLKVRGHNHADKQYVLWENDNRTLTAEQLESGAVGEQINEAY
jgi:Icc protein